MVRHYKTKTDRVKPQCDVIVAAVEDVSKNGYSLHQAASMHGLTYSFLRRSYVKFNRDESTSFDPDFTFKPVFTKAQENELALYLTTCSKM